MNQPRNPAIQPFNFQFGSTQRTIFGGPYRERFAGSFGVKMAEEIREACDIDVPTRDFDVPNPKVLDAGVRGALMSIARNKVVYVGCMGGIGRTGLFMAALAKTLEMPEPVKYVRANFKPHAVETKQQMRYIDEFKPSVKTRLMAEIAKAVAIFN